MSAGADQRGAYAALAVGVWVTLALCVVLWFVIDAVAFAAVHAATIEAVWIVALVACRGRGRKVVAFVGAGVTVGVLFALLGVFLRGYA